MHVWIAGPPERRARLRNVFQSDGQTECFRKNKSALRAPFQTTPIFMQSFACQEPVCQLALGLGLQIEKVILQWNKSEPSSSDSRILQISTS